MIRSALENIGLAFLYAFFAAVVLVFFSHYGMVQPLWPPAGIALFAFLQFGYRVWWGVFLGAFAAQYMAAYGHIAPQGTGDLYHYAALFIRASGATFQAVLGAYFLKRNLSFPLHLERGRDLFILTLLGGVLSCILSSFVGVTSLYMQGLISLDDVFLSFFIWWMGDVFGVVILTPLLLFLFQFPYDVSVRRKAFVVAPVFLAFVFLVLSDHYVRRSEKEIERNLLINKSDSVISKMNTELVSVTDILYALRSFHLSSTDIDRHEFRSFVTPYLEQIPFLNHIAWLPYIDKKNKEKFIRNAALDGLDFNPFGISQWGRDYIYPVYYIEPFQESIDAFGFDVASESLRDQTLHRAIGLKSPVLGGPLPMVTEKKNIKNSFLYMIPVFDERESDNGSGKLSGLYAVGFSAPRIFSAFQDILEEKKLFLEIRGGHENAVLYKNYGSVPAFEKNETYRAQYELGGQKWTFVFRDRDLFSEAMFLPHTFITGSLVLSFLTFLLIIITGRASLTEKMIGERIEELDESRQRMELAMEGVQDGVWDWNIATGECYYSDTFKKLLGYHNADFLGTIESWWNLLDKETKKRLRAALDQHRITKMPYFIEYQMTCYSGEQRWFEAKANSVWDENGNQIRMVGSIRDISDRKKIERQLLSEKEYSDYIVRKNPALVVGLDQKGEILFVNHKVCDLTGYSEADLIGRNWWEVMFPEDEYGQIGGISHDLAAYKEVSDYEMVLTAKDGAHYTISWNSHIKYAAQEEDGKNPEPAQILLFGLDLTDMLRFQDALMDAKEDADRANKTKSDFLANMSHEIRTPMNGIIGTASLMEETKLTKKQQNYLKIIMDSGSNLLNIINEILDYSKIEAGRFEINPTEIFNLQELLDIQFQLLRPLAQKKGLFFNLDINSDIPKWLVGDQTRVRQVILNLISNALKFTLEGGVSIMAETVPDRDYMVRFEIRDTGIGIPEDKKKDVFEAFSQLEDFQTKKETGTGLGLPISKYLVEHMGGKIGLESVAGEGTTFWFTIQFKEPSDEQLQKALQAEAQKQSLDREEVSFEKNILLVEDVATNQFVISDMLEGVGCTVDIAENGEIATKMVQKKDYDLILMDCQMPVMDGYEATREIRALGFEEIPIVALTANALKGDKEKCIKAGMDDFLSKPVEKKDLVEALMKNFKTREGDVS